MLSRVGLPALSILGLLANLPSGHAAPCDAPAPATALAPPSTSIPKSATAFAGAWQGAWPVVEHHRVAPLCARLYVAVDNATAASVEQCTGSLKAAHLAPRCKKYQAQILDGAMSFTDADGEVYTFTAADVGGILGEVVSADHKSMTQFIKAE
jgi:hypothetical protein